MTLPPDPRSAHPVAAPSRGPDSPLAAVLDWREALQRVEGDEAFLEELLTMFLEESPAMRNRLVEAEAGGDPVLLERAAHSLRGASATLSAREVTARAEAAEALARAGRLEEARAAVAPLLAAFDALVAALQSASRDGREAA